MKIEDLIYERFIKKILNMDANRHLYIFEKDYDNLKLNAQEEALVRKILREKNITIKREMITREDRSKLVRDYDYGDISGNNLESRDVAEKSVIEYDENGQIIFENFNELKKFIEEEFIPENVQMKKKKNKLTGGDDIFPSIQFNKIVKLKLTEAENKFLIDYLNENEIKVCGINPTLDGEFENYDYYRTFKNQILPEALSADDTIKKIILYKHTNDPILREQIIMDNMRLVGYITWKLARYYKFDQEELLQEGYISLIETLESFDYTKGNAFSTYASICIRGKSLRYIYGSLLGNNLTSAFFVAKKVVEEKHGIRIEEDRNYISEVVELMVKQGVISENSKDDVRTKIEMLLPISIEHMDEEIVANDSLISKVDHKYLKRMIDDVLNTLTPREAEIIRLRFGLNGEAPKPLEEVGKIFSLSRDRIRQIEAKALRKLRSPSRAKKLMHFDLQGVSENDNYLDTHSVIKR